MLLLLGLVIVNKGLTVFNILLIHDDIFIDDELIYLVISKVDIVNIGSFNMLIVMGVELTNGSSIKTKSNLVVPIVS